MEVTVHKITSINDAHMAIESTMQSGFVAKAPLIDIYRWEHSPSRTQLFWVSMIDVPTFVSTHFVRHSAVGQQHFVRSNRDDRGREGLVGSSLLYHGLSSSFFNDLFSYNDGELYWKKKLNKYCKYKVGDKAGYVGTRDKCSLIGIGNKALYRSVIIFMMFNGYRPPVVDHIDRDRTNDKIENLRPATQSNNMMNREYANKTGFKGVKKHNGGYEARIHLGGDTIYLGRRETPESAALLYDEYALKYFKEYALLNFDDAENPVTRRSIVTHRMLLNAQHLIDMARRRLCYKASPETRYAMMMIADKMIDVDAELTHYMVPNCVYRNGVCSEPRPCGNYKVKKYDPNEIERRIG